MKFNYLVIAITSSAIFLYSQASLGASTSEQKRVKTPSLRIINGEDAKKGGYPFITALINSDTEQGAVIEPFCGAAFVGGHYVMTASHCVEGSLAADIDVVVGGYDAEDSTSGVRYKVSQIYIHENYDPIEVNNDIAILELETAITNVPPIKPLPPELESTLEIGDILTVMGWGNMSVEGESYPTILQEVDVGLYDREACSEAYGGGLTEQM